MEYIFSISLPFLGAYPRMSGTKVSTIKVIFHKDVSTFAKIEIGSKNYKKHAELKKLASIGKWYPLSARTILSK